MNDKKVILFSSDATDLYKADIFRVLALPNEYTIQFRYERKYVQETLRDKPELLNGREAIVFFLTGNDLNKKFEERNLIHYPIRHCIIKESFLDNGTQQLMLILQLKEFVICEIDKITDAAKLPPYSFVSEAEVKDCRESYWLERVKTVRNHFKTNMFYHIEKILSEESRIKPIYSSARRISYFPIQEESEYSIECNCYDAGRGDTPLNIQCQSPDISLSNIFDTGVGALQDTRRLPMTTRLLVSRSAPADTIFYMGDAPEKDVNRVPIYWRLTRKSWKTFSFGFLTAIGARRYSQFWNRVLGCNEIFLTLSR